MASLLTRALDRSVVFSFDRTGYRRHARAFDAADLEVDLRGRVCLVTGANSGLGAATAAGLAARGATVHMLCRNVQKAEVVRSEILAEHGAATLHLEHVDLSDFASIRRFAAGFAPESIDVLVHNAGILPDARMESPDGLELTVATNLVGPFLLTRLLWPKLTPAARIVHVSSGGMYSAPLDVERLLDPEDPFDGVRAYALTKRAQVVLSEILAARSGRRVSSMHPGWADTPGVQTSLPRFHKLTRAILRTPEEGADTILWLAIAEAEAAADPRGRFFFDRAPQPTHMSRKTREREGERDRLFETLCELTFADPGQDYR